MSHVIYYGVLCVFWAVVWSAVYYLFDAYGKSTSLRGFFNRRDHVLVLLVAGAMPSVYLLSYAPTYSYAKAGNLADLYVPVDWFVDHTVMREPMLRWAEIWNARGAIESSSAYRMRTGTIWGTTSPTLYAMFWLVWGAICCIAPPYLLYWCVRRWNRWPGTKAGQGAVIEA